MIKRDEKEKQSCLYELAPWPLPQARAALYNSRGYQAYCILCESGSWVLSNTTGLLRYQAVTKNIRFGEGPSSLVTFELFQVHKVPSDHLIK